MITLHLEQHSGVAPYLQIVQQVKQALRLGRLEPGDKLPTVREAVTMLAINPNTILKAYRTLELEGLVSGRPGQGTFVIRSLPGIAPAELAALQRGFLQWLQRARAAGLDDDGIRALLASSMQAISAREGAEGEDIA